MPETVWFTSDTHFGHRGLVANGYRPAFSSVEEMDDALIYNWNSRVARHDRVYLLGDVSFHTREATREILTRLNGHVHVVRGNHDGVLDSVLKAEPGLVESYSLYKEIRIADQKLVLFHFPIASWHGMHRGSWMLHGHSHGNFADTGITRIDVGVDPRGFAPISFEEVAEIMAGRTYAAVDHHGHWE